MDTFLDNHLKQEAVEIHIQEYLHINIIWLMEETA